MSMKSSHTDAGLAAGDGVRSGAEPAPVPERVGSLIVSQVGGETAGQFCRTREADAISHRHTADWNERQNVRGAESRMLAFVRAHVDQFGGARDYSYRRVNNLFRCGHESYH